MPPILNILSTPHSFAAKRISGAILPSLSGGVSSVTDLQPAIFAGIA